MSKQKTLEEGQLLRYIGKNVDNFDLDDPFVEFLGYDSNGWNGVWVVYKGSNVYVDRGDLEIVSG
jgi:hypothetical protein